MINLITNKIAQSRAAGVQNPNQKGRINTATKPYANDTFTRSKSSECKSQTSFRGGIYINNPKEAAILRRIVEFKNSITKKIQEQREMGDEMLAILGEENTFKSEISKDHLGIAKAYMEYNPEDSMCQYHAHYAAQKAIKADPENHEAHHLYATLEGDDAEAMEHFQEALKLAPFNTQYLTSCARKNMEMGNREGAISNYTRLVELGPNDPDILLEKGSAHIAFGEHEIAIKDFDRVIELDPQKPDGYQAKGDALMFLQKYDESIEHYEKALKLKPDAEDVHAIHTNAGACHLIAQKYPEAIEHYNQALSLAPSAETYHKRAFAHFMLDNNEAAFADTKEAINQGGASSETIALQALCLSSLGRHVESRVLTNKARDAFPEFDFLQNQKDLSLFRLDFRKSQRGK